jgi:hypothetical protein
VVIDKIVVEEFSLGLFIIEKLTKEQEDVMKLLKLPPLMSKKTSKLTQRQLSLCLHLK